MRAQTHYMKLHPEPFDRIKAGLKTDELRLRDEKRRNIHVGDRIVFSRRPECVEHLAVDVISLMPHATFADMFESVKKRYPGTDREGFIASLREYYSEEDERKFGALEIGIRNVLSPMPLTAQNVIAEVKRLDLPAGRYLIAGSGILGALGIREIDDIDFLVTPDLFDALIQRGWKYDEVEIEGRVRQVASSGIFEAYKDFWYSGITRDVPQMIRDAVFIHGLPFLSLEELKGIKRLLGRDKDLKDVALIEAFQDMGGAIQGR